MEVTFGAVGDFISVGVLINDLITLLDDSRGSAWEYEALIQQLGSLRRYLATAKDLYGQNCDIPEFSDIRTALDAVVDEAKRRLEEIHHKVDKYGSTLCQGSTKREIQRIFRKVQWSLGKRDTEKFLKDLHRYITIIHALKSDALGRTTQRNFDDARKNNVNTQNLVKQLQNDLTTVADRLTTMEGEFRAVQERSENTQEYLVSLGQLLTQRLDDVTQRVNSIGIVALKGASGIIYFGSLVLRLLSIMQSSVMNRLERPLHLGPVVYFEDYMSVNAVIPLQYIDSWAAFEGSLHGKYKGRKGGRRVSRNRFLVRNRESGQEVHRDSKWDLSFAPGCRLDMSLICEVEEYEQETQILTCPFTSCKGQCEGVPGTVVKCPLCWQLFRKFSGQTNDEAVNLPKAPVLPRPEASQIQIRKRVSESDIRLSLRDRRKMSTSAIFSGSKTLSPGDTESDSEDSDLTGGIRKVTIRKFSRPLKSAPRQAWENKPTRSGDPSTNDDSSDNGDEQTSIRGQTYTILGPPEDTQQVKETSFCVFTRILMNGKVQQLKAVSTFDTRGTNSSSEHWPLGVVNFLTNVKTGAGVQINYACPEEDGIPEGYSLEFWDIELAPILLLRSVFDANSLGKWIYDWALFAQPAEEFLTETAREFCSLLTLWSSKVRRAKKHSSMLENKKSKRTVDIFIDSGERMYERLRNLVRLCESAMLQAARKAAEEMDDGQDQGCTETRGDMETTTESGLEVSEGTAGIRDSESMPADAQSDTSMDSEDDVKDRRKRRFIQVLSTGVAFVRIMFEAYGELGRTERLMQSMHAFNDRFDAIVGPILTTYKGGHSDKVADDSRTISVVYR